MMQSASMAALQSLREVAMVSSGSPVDRSAVARNNDQATLQSPENINNNYLVQPSADQLTSMWTNSLSGPSPSIV